jgi:hypothetical protein
MRVTYRIAEKDILEAQTRHSGLPLRFLQAFGVFMIAMGLLGFFVNRTQPLGAIAPIIIGLFLIFRLHLTARAYFKRDFAQGAEVTMETSDYGISFSEPKGNSESQWDRFVRYAETNSLFLLYFQTNLFQVVPKRAFAPGEESNFREVFREKLGAKSARKGKRVDIRFIAILAIVLIAMILVFLSTRHNS